MFYGKNHILQLQDKFDKTDKIYARLVQKLAALQLELKNVKAREYLLQGVGRRLSVLTRCLYNIYEIFPVDRTELLRKEELKDLDINLHAFFININGILDNLAWVIIHENDLLGKPKEGRVSRSGVGLFNKKTQEHLNPKLCAYLSSSKMQAWYRNYSKNYRDALAHRIPPYVPPVALNKAEKEEYLSLEKALLDYSSPENIAKHDGIRKKQSQLGNPCFVFAHAYSEGGKPLLLHAQIIADFVTIEEIVNKFCSYFKI